MVKAAPSPALHLPREAFPSPHVCNLPTAIPFGGNRTPRDLWLGEGLPVPVAVIQYIVVDNYRELSWLAPVTQKLETADLTWKQKELCD